MIWTKNFVRFFFFLVLLTGMVLSSCDCDSGIAVVACQNDDQCKAGEKCVDKKCQQIEICKTDVQCTSGKVCVDGLCVQTGGCKQDADCGSGKKCINGSCSGGCSADSSCTDGKICCDFGTGAGKQCKFARCFTNEDCRVNSKNTCVSPLSCGSNETSICHNGLCKCEKPCGGADCGSGRCCDVTNDKCVDNPKPCASLTCPAGYDPPESSLFQVDETCNVAGPECKCTKKAPLELGRIGLFTSMKRSNGKNILSGYSEKYGDLVFATQQADGSLEWEFVDGIPANAPVVGDPDGPRKGIAEVGDDVGENTSLAVSSTGTLFIAYRDVTNNSLKLASKTTTLWEKHVVFKGSANQKGVAYFVSMTLVNSKPVIAFMIEDDNGQSGLWVAKAQNTAPSKDTDWVVSKVTSTKIKSCRGACDASKKEVCIKVSSSNYQCQIETAKAADCKPTACEAGFSCISGQCKELVSSVTPALPYGTGLFPSIAPLSTGGFVITFYDNDNGDLKVAYATSPSSSVSVSTLISVGDVGQFNSLVADGTNQLHVSYVDMENNNLHYAKFQISPSVKVLVNELVDKSETTDGINLLADTAIVVSASGDVRIVYQDSTVQSLKIAHKVSSTWKVVKLAGDKEPYQGAFGFFNNHLLDGSNSIISTFRYDLKGTKDDSGVDIRTWKP